MTGYVPLYVLPTDMTTDIRRSLETDCDVYDTDNAGCGVALADDNSFGPDFNSIGGGWWVSRSHVLLGDKLI